MWKYFFLILAAFVLISCTSWRYLSAPKFDLSQIERIPFDDLKLKPAHNLLDYRYDVIRQGVSLDCWHEEESHPLGFQLGNGLFFDLEDNLTLDLFYMLELSKETGFTVLESNTLFPREQERKISVEANQSCAQMVNQENTFCLQYEKTENGLDVKQNQRFLYTVLETNEGIQLLNRQGRMTDRIKALGKHTFTHHLNRDVEQFTKQGNNLRLKTIRVTLTPAKDEIQIYRKRAGQYKLRHRIIRSKSHLYILDQFGHGSEIKIQENQLITKGDRSQSVKLQVLR
ncbi:MAG: hypothetical protein AAF598_05815 [Bacteroidota bacterium]